MVVVERRSKLAARPVEDLGAYDMRTKAASFKKERALHWIKNGAKPSVTAHNLLVSKGVIEGKKIQLHIKHKAVGEKATEAEVAQKIETTSKAEEVSKKEETAKEAAVEVK